MSVCKYFFLLLECNNWFFSKLAYFSRKLLVSRTKPTNVKERLHNEALLILASFVFLWHYWFFNYKTAHDIIR